METSACNFKKSLSGSSFTVLISSLWHVGRVPRKVQREKPPLGKQVLPIRAAFLYISIPHGIKTQSKAMNAQNLSPSPPLFFSKREGDQIRRFRLGCPGSSYFGKRWSPMHEPYNSLKRPSHMFHSEKWQAVPLCNCIDNCIDKIPSELQFSLVKWMSYIVSLSLK